MRTGKRKLEDYLSKLLPLRNLVCLVSPQRSEARLRRRPHETLRFVADSFREENQPFNAAVSVLSERNYFVFNKLKRYTRKIFAQYTCCIAPRLFCCVLFLGPNQTDALIRRNCRRSCEPISSQSLLDSVIVIVIDSVIVYSAVREEAACAESSQ